MILRQSANKISANLREPTTRLVLLLISILSPAILLSQSLPNEDRCYNSSVKTIQVYKEGVDLSPPVIQLNSGERLLIQFDDLDPDIRRYKFTILHCEADWSTSADLAVSDFISGYTEENIDRYDYSYNTTVRYTHFTTTFPTDHMTPKLSGNYILVVYDDDPSQVTFTRRFMVVEPTPVTIHGNVVQSAQVADRYTRQQVDFLVRLNGFQVLDVEREIRINVVQNSRWDNFLKLSKPRFARTGELDYRYDESISFNGGNQFRYFDFMSLQYQSERILKITYDTTNQVYLLPDQPRTFKQYVLEKDINGKYLIKNQDHAEKSDIEADYGWVHFYLPYTAMITTGTFHILGELTSWQADENSRMYFNPAHKGYELNLFLKQGYYNYMYVLKEDKPAWDETLIEGNHWETENDYTIYVYYHETGSLYDRLIGLEYLNSLKNRP